MAEEDILYGKKRHLFGGIEPSNMNKFEVYEKDGTVVIDAKLPEDTIVDGQTLCTVAGAVIRRKEYGYPVDEFDGDFMGDITSDAVIVDYDAVVGGPSFYYKAFPYTTQGVYNRSDNNIASYNVPLPVTNVSYKLNYLYSNDTSTITLSMNVPLDTTDIFIRRSKDGYPKSYDDGVDFKDGSSGLITYGPSWYPNGEMSITSNELNVGDTHYISIFTVLGDNHNISSNPVKLAVYCGRYNYLYGYDLDTTDENPETRVTYPDGVMNKNYSPVFMDYIHGKFNYGDWNLDPGEDFMPKPCMITYEGEVVQYLDPNNYTLQEDGVNPSFVSDLGFSGNAMMEWPKIYTKRWEENGIYHFRCSDKKIDSDWDCWCNYDDNDNIIDHFYTSIYASYYSTTSVSTGQRLRSISGTTIKTGLDSTEYRSASIYKDSGTSKYDSGWDVSLLADHLLIQDLLILISKSTNTQASFGNGVVDNSGVTTNGNMDDKGLFWGCNDSTHGVKIFGMENLWGANKRIIAGWATSGNVHRVKITRGMHDGVGTSADTAQKRWQRLGVDYFSNNIKAVSAISGSSDSYINGMVTLPYGRMPNSTGGSSTTYECDTIAYTGSTTTQVYYAGGCKVVNSTVTPFSAGIFYAYNASSTSGMSDGCAYLSFKPPYKG